MSENEVSSHKELFTDTKNNVHFNNSTIISTDVNTKFQASISEHEGFFAEFSQSKVSQLRSVRRSPRLYLILISNSLQNYDKLR